ncbi:hypothetical protein H6P81_001283 [Aristolochia fimbriata]|uniref:UDP-glycosyltransferase 82A1 n=1 Tax=Aristolochia fimbriata TaxID=158543 RepID=A0AAV7F940_ARIFI|nr:hypothetical protein H6P81_001283 [Aristolochia fimbriata]
MEIFQDLLEFLLEFSSLLSVPGSPTPVIVSAIDISASVKKHLILSATADSRDHCCGTLKRKASPLVHSTRERIALMKYESRARIILVPYPAQGHVTPMLQLASTFHDHGLQPLVVLPDFIYDTVVGKTGAAASGGSVMLVSLPSGLAPDEPKDFFSIGYAMEHHMPGHFRDVLIDQYSHGDEGRVVCVVVDLLASWAIDVARRCEIPVAGFWPAMLATYHLIAAIPHLIRSGLVSDNGTPLQKGPVRFLPGQPMLNAQDLPWLVGNPASRKSRFTFWLQTLQRSRSIKWLLINSFLEAPTIQVESDDVSTLQRPQPLIFQVGPLTRQHSKSCPSPTFWNEDRTCLEWLNEQPTSSVIYVSFGSWVKPIEDEKITQLALGLESTRRPFLWVLGPVWRDCLPSGFVDRVKDRSKVVDWAPQKEVLAHVAVGCYLTHCGWNSTLEAIQAEKLLLCYPVSGDQFVNCRYIVKFWGIGEEVGGGTRHDVEEGVRRLMEGGGDMQRRVRELKERVMGEEASKRAASLLMDFLDMIRDLRRVQAEDHLGALPCPGPRNTYASIGKNLPRTITVFNPWLSFLILSTTASSPNSVPPLLLAGLILTCYSPYPPGLRRTSPRTTFAPSPTRAMENHMPGHFRDVLDDHQTSHGDVVCVVVDLLASWAIDVAGRCGVPVAGFWPAMLATYHLIAAIPRLIRSGLLSEEGTPLRKGPVRYIPGQPMLNAQDLPWLVGNPAARKARFTFWMQTLHRSRSIKWLLVNSFGTDVKDDGEENNGEDVQTLGRPLILRVGPLTRHCESKSCPSPTFWNEDRTCLEWLNQQPTSSVIYGSFGSWVKPIEDAKVAQLGLGLEATARPFLWVLGRAWRAGLPFGFLDRVKDRSMVVDWAPQKEILAHEAVGCYLTHCGWELHPGSDTGREATPLLPGFRRSVCELPLHRQGLGNRGSGGCGDAARRGGRCEETDGRRWRHAEEGREIERKSDGRRSA